jgi:hypothetical protein
VDGFPNLDGDAEPDCTDADADGDSLPDAWEQANGLDLADADSASQDPDLDGRTNAEEFSSGSDPNGYGGPGAPEPISPEAEARVADATPSLKVANADSPSSLPLTYVWELYGDLALGDLVAAEEDVVEGVTGETGWTVPFDLDEDRRYWWRAAASDGVLQGPWSAVRAFVVETEDAPPSGTSFVFPTDGAQIGAVRPVITVTEAWDAEDGPVWHHLEVGTSDTFAGAAVLVLMGGGEGDELRFDLSDALPANTEIHARVWAIDDAGNDGPAETIRFFVRGVNDAPSVPRLDEPEDGATVDSATEFHASGAVDPEGDALSYDFILALDVELTEIVAQRSAADVVDIAAVGMTPPIAGTLYWSSRARDALGAASGWAPPRSLEVEAGHGCEAQGNAAWVLLPAGLFLGPRGWRRRRGVSLLLGLGLGIGGSGCLLPGAETLYTIEPASRPGDSSPELDADGDGSLAGVDCDDNDARNTPGASEQCDGVDNDCDGAPGAGEADDDGDGESGCQGDCNDGDANVGSQAEEHCDARDEDCDGLLDDGAVDCPCDAATREDGSAWLFCAEAGTWTEAVTLCADEGYRLALPWNEGEMAFIAEGAGAVGDVWLALSDAETEQNWKNLDGGPPSYVNWAPQEPSSAPVADCLLLPSPGPGLWRAVDCLDGAGAVCEARP